MIPCPICQRPFTPAGKRMYCRDACAAAAYRRRKRAALAPVAIPEAQPRRPITVYPSVDLYLPGRGKSANSAINFGTVSCTEERTVGHLESLRQLATRTSQLAKGFLGYQIFRKPDFLLAASDLSLPEPNSG